MKKNIGTIDRIARVVVALVIIGLYFAGQVTGLVATILLIFAVVFIATSAVSFCPLYLPFKMSTKKED